MKLDAAEQTPTTEEAPMDETDDADTDDNDVVDFVKAVRAMEILGVFIGCAGCCGFLQLFVAKNQESFLKIAAATGTVAGVFI